jgi:hypothetical protein
MLFSNNTVVHLACATHYKPQKHTNLNYKKLIKSGCDVGLQVLILTRDIWMSVSEC